MDIFKSNSFVEFIDRFSTDLDCKSYLADIKWSNGFVCKKCGHNKFSLRDDYTHKCTYCKKNESPTANTTFHKGDS